MISLKVAESKALHRKIIQGGFLDAIRSPEEASGFLTEAMEHERWSRTYKDFTAFQLERAKEDVQAAEEQLKSAEEYMCSIIDAIRCLGFTVEFMDSQTAAVVKRHDKTHTVSVSGSPAISLLLD